ncbi:Pilin (type 1 fimbria component protein) [Pseudomonas sp. UC 17F4]|uniref:fimbrial protein n=1 Tax=Pseudomonas sp. UC 17F4 TaxID=1855328 RepID=UPI000881F22B|nr:fimbrial protein [Pseudomonas sp. UC 17F4]SDQ71270.1 Pilin (type 1 fimbria component protein) [Pseudomonas sp. UC 17F4]
MNFSSRALMVLGASVTTLALAADNGEQNAFFQISGTLLESACYLDPASTYQELDLGDLSTAALYRPGDQGTPRALQLRLQGCVRVNGGRQDVQSGALVWSSVEPVLGLSFNAVVDADSPELVKVIGASGFGLRVTDVRGQDVRLGRLAPAWFLAPGSNQLTYYVRPERTTAPLLPGPFRASLNVNLAYD